MQLIPKQKSFLFWLGISVLIPFLIYPYFFLGLKTPVMVPTGSLALNDVNVGPLTFFGGIRSFTYEFWNHGQVLWTSLKGQGVPLLAHDIQSAPLNPLSWLSLILDESTFWSVWGTLRLILLTLGSLLIGSRIYKLEVWPAILFAVTLVFGNYVIGWSNHPWQTAMLYGIWVFYFSYELFFGVGRIGSCLGLVLSTYGLINSGFPGGTVVFSLSFFFLFAPYFWEFCRNTEIHFQTRAFRIFLFFLCVVLGTGFSAFTLFSLFEYVGLAGDDFRSRFATMTLPASVFLDILFRLDHPANLHAGTSTLRLIPSLFFWTGVLATLKGLRKLNLGDCSVLFLLIFFCVKLLNFIPPLNDWISALPVIRNTKFWNFSFVMFLFFWAYYAAQGLHQLLHNPKKSRKLLLISATLTYLWLALGIFRRIEIGGAFVAQRILVGIFSVIFIFVFLKILNSPNSHTPKKSLWLGLIFCFGFELLFVNSSSFLSRRSPDYIQNLENSRFQNLLKPLLETNRDAFLNYRTVDQNGLLIGMGIPTIDVGATAILTKRYSEQRTTLFNSEWNGYMPLNGPKHPLAWDWTAAGFLTDANFRSELFDKGQAHFKLDPQTLPRSFLSKSCVSVESIGEAKTLLENHQNLKKGLVLLELKPNDTDSKNFCKSLIPASEIFSIAKVVSDHGNKVEIEKIQGPGVLVLADQFYPGWRAFDLLTQTELPVFPVQMAQRGLLLKEARSYQIRWSYQPDWLPIAKASIGMSGVGLFLVLGLLFLRSKNHSKKGLLKDPLI